MAEAPDTQWSEVAHHALVDGFLAPALYQKDARTLVADGLVLVKSRVNYFWWSVAFQVTNELSGEEALQRAEQFFGAERFTIYARNWADQEFAAAAIKRDHEVSESDQPYMIAESGPGAFELPDGFTVVSQPSEKLAKDFAEVGGTVFGTSASDLEATRNSLTPDEIFTPFSEYFVGYVDGEPVATTCYWFSRRVATFYWVGTLPEYRKRGFAQAILKTAWNAAIKQGTSAVTLQASKEGHPIYLRNGFRDVGSYTKLIRKGA